MPRIRTYLWANWAREAVRKFDRDQPQIIAVDTETTGVGFYDEPFAATLTWRDGQGEIVNVYLGLEGDEREVVVDLLRSMLSRTPTWLFHNAKFDLQKLLLIGATDWPTLESRTIHDTQTLYTLLDENGRKGLKHLAATVLGVEDVIAVETKSGPNKGQTKLVPKEQHILNVTRRKLKLTKDDGYHLLPREVIIPYALKDTEFTLRLYEVLRPRLEAVGDPKLLTIYQERIELKLALLEMEADGFGLDMDYVDETTSEYGVRVMDQWSDVVRLVGDKDFNPGSPAQILAAFERRGIHLDNTQASTLTLLDDELARTLISYRETQKIYKTYLRALQHEQRDGIVHPNFNDDAARSGRMSSSTASNN